jgi:serine/threonine protein kinase
MRSNTATKCQKCGKTFAAAPGISLSTWLFRLPECRCESEITVPYTETQQAKTAVAHRRESTGSILLDRYEVLSQLGEGGMGEVYEVLDRQSGGRFAMKLISRQHADLPNVERRLEHEARAASTLSHPNIVGVHGFGNLEHGSPYLLMDYVDGETLEDLLKARGKLDSACALDIFLQVTAALTHAHAKGVVHRDLKPSNVLLVSKDGNEFAVKLTDFGIAKITEPNDAERAKLTQTGEIIGSPLFMSPEQCKGENLDARSDIYSLGCMLFASLSGRNPFEGENPVKILLKHISQDAPPLPSELNLKPAWNQVIKSCLAKEPADRYQNAQSLLQDLERLRDGKALGPGRLRLTKAQIARLKSGAFVTAGMVAAAWAVLVLDQSRIVRPADSNKNLDKPARVQILPQKLISTEFTVKAPESVPSKAASKRFERVVDLEKHHNYREAIEEISLALADPTLKNDRPLFLNEKANIAISRKDSKGASEYFAESLKIKPLATTFIKRGSLLLETGDPVNALGDFDEALLIDPASHDAERLRTLAYERLKERLAKPDARSLEPTKAITLDKKVQRESAEALSAPGKAAAETPLISERDVTPHHEEPETNHPSSSQQSLLEHQEGLTHEPADYTDSFCTRPEKGLEIHVALQSAPPNIEDAYKNATAFFRAKKFRKAASAMRTVAESDSFKSYSAWAYSIIGLCFQSAKDYSSALAACDKAVALSQEKATNRFLNYPLALLNRAHCWSRSGDDQKALADLNTAIGRYPSLVNGYKQRSAVYSKLGRDADAAQDQETYRKLILK